MDRRKAVTYAMSASQNESIRDTLREYGSRLLQFIRNRVDEPEDAEDIFQDVFYELTSTVQFSEPIQTMSAWLYRVARNKITDRYRKKRPELLADRVISRGDTEGESLFLEDLLASAGTSPEADFDRTLIWQAIEKALSKLPAEQRYVFVGHELEGKSYQEMEAETGASLNTLLSRKRYAIKALRTELQDLYDELIN